MIIADYHVHSDFSSDSTTAMEQMIKQGIRLGLEKICFTDHMDYDYPPECEYTFLFDLKEYCHRLKELKNAYHAKIDILTGIELGLQPHLGKQLSALVNSYPFDFIIGSSHVVDKMDPYYPQYWTLHSKEEGIRKYFQSILDNCNAFNGFHVYGHIDYIVRYIPGDLAVKSYRYSDYIDLLDQVLKTIISKGKGIEINTAGFKYGLGHTHPKSDIIKRYKELGGEVITIGSDAHIPEHLGYDFSRTAELIKYCGFDYYTIFEKGLPSFLKL